jgi:hypothetical protein
MNGTNTHIMVTSLEKLKTKNRNSTAEGMSLAAHNNFPL